MVVVHGWNQARRVSQRVTGRSSYLLALACVIVLVTSCAEAPASRTTPSALDVHGVGARIIRQEWWLLVACQSAPPSPGDPIQVAWGATVYRLQCACCHAPGHVAPVLTAERLIRYGNAHDLYVYIQQTMPLDKPCALPEQDYWDVTAYLFANADMLLVPTLQLLGPDIADKVSFLPQ